MAARGARATPITACCCREASSAWTRSSNLPTGAELGAGDYLITATAYDRYDNRTVVTRNFSIVPVPPLSIDAHLRADSSQSWLGEGFDNNNGVGQTLNATIHAGETQTRQIRIVRHGGAGSKTVRVTLPDWANDDWAARFTDTASGADITAQITSAQGWNITMNEGEARRLDVQVTAPLGIRAGNTKFLKMRAEADSTSETPARDVIRAGWLVVAPTADLSIRAGQSGAWLGERVYNQAGYNQTLQQVAGSSHVVRGQLKLSVYQGADGEPLRWSVPDWAAFSADGWSVRLWDAAVGGDEITEQMAGEGWTSAHADGLHKVIRYEISAPASATEVTRVLSVRAQADSGGVADVVKVSVRVLRNVQPDVAVRRKDQSEWVGQNLFSPTAQRLELITTVGSPQKFEVKITNPTGASAQFLFEPPTDLPDGWSYKLLDEQGAWLNAPDSDDSTIFTPFIAPYQSLSWTLELATSPTNGSARVVPVVFSGGGAVDKCQLAVRLQGIVGADYSLDGGMTWKRVEGETLSVPPGSTVGFMALPMNPDVPWPDDPFAPIWYHNGNPYWGELTYLYYPTPTMPGQDGEAVNVSCGNTFSMKVKVEEKTDNQTP